jgi:hypothetical protein
MSISKWFSVVLFVVLTTSCGKEKVSIDNFNDSDFKKDRKGCQGLRQSQIESLLNQKTKLLALGEVDIVSVLGKPDENELYKRNQKFYYYYLQPGEQCDPTLAKAERLVIRFNAVGLAKEILVE